MILTSLLFVGGCIDEENSPRNQKKGRNSQQVGSGGHLVLRVGRGQRGLTSSVIDDGT